MSSPPTIQDLDCADFDFCVSRRDLSITQHSEFSPILLLLSSLNVFALKATPLLSRRITQCHSRQDMVDTKDKGSQQRRWTPEARWTAFFKLLPNLSVCLEIVMEKVRHIHIKFSSYVRKKRLCCCCSYLYSLPLVFICCSVSVATIFISLCLSFCLSLSVFFTKSITSNRFWT